MDTTNYINILESSNQMLQHQNSIIIGFIGILIAVFVILLGTSWFWNTTRIKQKIRNELRNDFDHYKEELTATLSTQLDEQIKVGLKELKFELKIANAEQSRLFALSATEAGVIDSGIFNWSLALVAYQEIGDDKRVRICVNNILDLLGGSRGHVQLIESQIDQVETNIDKIPEILSTEKEEILSLLQDQKQQLN